MYMGASHSHLSASSIIPFLPVILVLRFRNAREKLHYHIAVTTASVSC